MLKIRDFRCSRCNTISEELVEDTATSIACPQCTSPAVKIITPINFHLDHTFPGQADKWARQHETDAKNPDKAHVHT